MQWLNSPDWQAGYRRGEDSTCVASCDRTWHHPALHALLLPDGLPLHVLQLPVSLTHSCGWTAGLGARIQHYAVPRICRQIDPGLVRLGPHCRYQPTQKHHRSRPRYRCLRHDHERGRQERVKSL